MRDSRARRFPDGQSFVQMPQFPDGAMLVPQTVSVVRGTRAEYTSAQGFTPQYGFVPLPVIVDPVSRRLPTVLLASTPKAPLFVTVQAVTNKVLPAIPMDTLSEIVVRVTYPFHGMRRRRS